MNIKHGFTLSELIVALAVIGIIAAMTVPSVVTRYQKDTQVTMLKKAYSNLQDRLLNLETENIGRNLYYSVLGSENLLDPENHDPNVKKFVQDNYIITRDCNTTPQPCFATTYKNLNNDVSDFSPENDKAYSALLSDGSAIYIIPAGDVDDNIPATFYVDVNGPGKPNIYGRDFFKIHIYKDYSVDVIDMSIAADEDPATRRKNLFDDKCKSSNDATGCFGKILNDNWKMNY